MKNKTESECILRMTIVYYVMNSVCVFYSCASKCFDDTKALFVE